VELDKSAYNSQPAHDKHNNSFDHRHTLSCCSLHFSKMAKNRRKNIV
jgi:hypothetical protein